MKYLLGIITVLSFASLQNLAAAQTYTPPSQANVKLSPVQKQASTDYQKLWSDLNMTKDEFFVIFCTQRNLIIGSDACKKAFLKEWGQSSWTTGKAYSKQGFKDLDKAAKHGTRKLGSIWEAYSQEFKKGRAQVKTP